MMKTLHTSMCLMILAASEVVHAFAPNGKQINVQRIIIPNKEQFSSPISTLLSPSTSTCSRSTSTSLNWGVLVNVPDDFFTITGISIGFAYTILRSWNRVTVENISWENRLEDARLAKLDEDEEGSTYTELELRKMDAAASKSAYGPDAMYERERKNGRGRRVGTLEREDDDEERYRGERTYSMSDEQIAEFEDKYGVEYDPYYDEPYTEDELPDDMSFVVDKVYGDRRYENGEIFYQDEGNKNLYWRQGGRPRLKQVWEMF